MLAQQIKEELNSFKMVSYIVAIHTTAANTHAGDGSARAVKTTHPFFLMIMHPHLDIMASWRIPFSYTWDWSK